MDTHHATIVGRKCRFRFVVLGHETYGQGYNTSENAANNAERSAKLFKSIAAHMQKT
jgi:hypothetical protein